MHRSPVRRLASLCALAVGLTAASAQATVVTREQAGKLVGASGVVVEGKTYNLSFVEGTCIGLFSGCDAKTDFTFQTLTSAQAASQALLSTVFLDFGGSRNFDTNPALTYGCTATYCHSFTPYDILNGSMYFAYSDNEVSNGSDVVRNASVARSYDTFATNYNSFAVWTQASAVPEPSSIALVGLAVAALGWTQRRRVSGKMANMVG